MELHFWDLKIWHLAKVEQGLTEDELLVCPSLLSWQEVFPI